MSYNQLCGKSIRNNLKQIIPELIGEPYYSQQLFVSCAVFQLCRSQTVVTELYCPLFAMANLIKVPCNAFVSRVKLFSGFGQINMGPQ